MLDSCKEARKRKDKKGRDLEGGRESRGRWGGGGVGERGGGEGGRLRGSVPCMPLCYLYELAITMQL